MSDNSTAFFKGGMGCLGAFLAIGLLCVIVGGSMHLDLGGAVCLFVVGGLIGLIFLTVYNKGAREAAHTPYAAIHCSSCHQPLDGPSTYCPHCGAPVS